MWPNETAICSVSARSANQAHDWMFERNQFIDLICPAPAAPRSPDLNRGQANRNALGNPFDSIASLFRPIAHSTYVV